MSRLSDISKSIEKIEFVWFVPFLDSNLCGMAQGFFSKFLMGWTHNFSSPSVPDGDEVGWGGGGTCKKNPAEAETAHLMQNKAIFCYFNHEIQLFKVLLSLK